MDTFKKHELFEIEVLEKLNSGRFLEPLVFGGGTMLRLCYDLNRYSVDLDFWLIKKKESDQYFERLKNYLSKTYDLTDAAVKHFTYLFELRSKVYSRRLKIEIRKEVVKQDFETRIAFSNYDSKQISIKVHTLEQCMKNKIEAALSRSEIRDFFDLEFILRQGVKFPEVKSEKLTEIKKKLEKLTPIDFKVTLGSLLDRETRAFYNKNRFSFLEAKIQERLNLVF